VRGPNSGRGQNHINGTHPLQHGAPFKGAPNEASRSNHINGTMPTSGRAGGLPNPNERHRFDVTHARDGYDGVSGAYTHLPSSAVPVDPDRDTKNPFSRDTFVPAHLLRSDSRKAR
jgi:hypothetical protein